MNKTNPFRIQGMSNYKQYSGTPFLETETNKLISNAMKNIIQEGFIAPQWAMLIGDKGAGKTTNLYYIYDLLKDHCNTILLEKYFVSDGDFNLLTGQSIKKLLDEGPLYILMDFPDTIQERKKFKDFLDFCWHLITRENNQNMNLIFALNPSHYDRSFNYSEILGKFHAYRIRALSREESEELVRQRLKHHEIEGDFSDIVYDLIYNYSSGIARNIICAAKDLFDAFGGNIKEVDYEKAKKILKESYITTIISDRVEDLVKRELLEKVINLMSKKCSLNQSQLVDEINESLGIGKVRAQEYLKELYKYGVITYYKRGNTKNEKVWSLLNGNKSIK